MGVEVIVGVCVGDRATVSVRTGEEVNKRSLDVDVPRGTGVDVLQDKEANRTTTRTNEI
jgi:hypothetical protein